MERDAMPIPQDTEKTMPCFTDRAGALMTGRAFAFAATFLASLAALTGVYRDTIVWLIERYLAPDSYYSHGFLVPAVSAYLVWRKRSAIARLRVKPDVRGLALVAAALAVHVFCREANVHFVSGFTIMAVGAGMCLYLFGPEITRALRVPIFFLFFMFPLPLAAVQSISFPMKVLATKASVFVLDSVLGVPLRTNGFHIAFGQNSLVVGNPCSGLRSLLSITAIAVLFSSVMNASLMKRLLVCALAAPLAIAANIGRILLLCLAVFVYGEGAAQGLFHDLTGYLAFAASVLGLWYVVRRVSCGK